MKYVFTLCVLGSFLFTFTGCTEAIQDQASKTSADITKTATETYKNIEDTANATKVKLETTVQEIERKVEQGNELIKSTQETLDKLNEFTSE